MHAPKKQKTKNKIDVLKKPQKKNTDPHKQKSELYLIM